MKKLPLLASMLAVGTVACAQVAKKPAKPAASTPYANGITAADLKKHLYIIAGDEMEGRETGKPGQYKAAKYIAEQFKRVGLQPGGKDGQWEQPFSLFQDTLTRSSITAGGKTYEFGNGFYSALRETVNQTLGQTAVVYAGYGITHEAQDSYKDLDLNDKIVIVADGEPMNAEGKPLIPRQEGQQGLQLKDKLRAAANKGARAVFLVSDRVPAMGRAGDRLRRTGLYFETMTTMEFIPNAYFISPDLASAILGKPWSELAASLKAGRQEAATGQVSELVFEKGKNEIKSSNVLGILPGTDKKDEYLFITAHYDHIGIIGGKVHNGADDDGSGTVAVIEMAEAFMKAKKAGKGPRRSIVFMTVAGEEKGLLGSRYYTDNPIYPLQETVADLNIDMIGRIDADHKKDSNYVYIIGDDKLSSDMRPISEAANEQTKLKLDYRYNDPNDPNRFYYRSDHYMFAQHKIPIIFYFNGVHPDYHGEGDEPHKISYGLLAKRAQLVFHTAWSIANRDDRPKVDRNEK
ncbi:M28 family peptidase [Chitinophaga barathri]|uniref:M28 family peptidase n=1 Tax=Chitinophaga barathri TaxID=1647451 RepID=A0A3N4MAC3_9BACT|nr:M28 family peptidase [Chitinophaga barathri]RPD40418.1 M28 family peptidase [Chitinophaga barathri]